MSPSILFRLSGISMLLGGVLGTVAVALHPANMTDAVNIPVHLALYTAVMLVALGLPGFYARQAERAGVLGLIGTAALFLGLVFADPIHSVLEFTVIPVLASNPAARPILDGPPPGLMEPLMVAIPVLLIGLVLLAIASLRAGIFPRWPAIMAFATAVMVVVGFLLAPPGGSESPLSNIGPALLYLTLAAFGYVLTTGQVRATQPTRLMAGPAHG